MYHGYDPKSVYKEVTRRRELVVRPSRYDPLERVQKEKQDE